MTREVEDLKHDHLIKQRELEEEIRFLQKQIERDS